QGLGHGSKQDVVDDLFVLVSDGSDLFGDGEDDMEIVRGEDFGHSLLDPLRTREGLALWAMAVPAANGVLSITCIMERFFNSRVRSARCHVLTGQTGFRWLADSP